MHLQIDVTEHAGYTVLSPQGEIDFATARSSHCVERPTPPRPDTRLQRVTGDLQQRPSRGDRNTQIGPWTAFPTANRIGGDGADKKRAADFRGTPHNPWHAGNRGRRELDQEGCPASSGQQQRTGGHADRSYPPRTYQVGRAADPNLPAGEGQYKARKGPDGRHKVACPRAHARTVAIRGGVVRPPCAVGGPPPGGPGPSQGGRGLCMALLASVLFRRLRRIQS